MLHPRFSTGGFLILFSAYFLLLSQANAANREYSIEAGINNGYTGNLVKDSSDRKDTYSNASLRMKLYPLSMTQVTLSTEYTYYSRNFQLSNFQYGGGLTFIPTSGDSRLAVYVDGNYKHHKYREPNLAAGPDGRIPRNDFPTEDIDATASLSYRFNPAFRFRMGSIFTSTGYSTSDLDSRNKLQAFAGWNMSLFNKISLDVEGGYNYGNFSYVNAYKTIFDTIVVRYAVVDGQQYSILQEGRLKSFYISPRLSLPIGQRTGVSLTFGYRSFIDKDSAAIVYGYSTGYVSPWANEYDGNSIQARIKTYLVPHLVTTVGAGYWNKAYQNTIERHELGNGTIVVSTKFAQSRSDDESRAYLNIQVPLVIGHQYHIEPSIRLDYTHNSSTIDVYRYSDLSISTAFNLQL
jgi:hypothetical protein